MQKSIHFILPGGGARGSFQAGFLYELFSNYKDLFTIYRIDGTSVGALNGVSTIMGEYEVLKSTWKNIDTITDLFSNWSNTPIIGSLSNIYYGFYNNGMYSNNQLQHLLYDKLGKKIKEFTKEDLDKYSCVVTNIDTATCEYISGSNDNILDYVTGSASPWVISNPIVIDGAKYSDGCILETCPIKNIEASEADLVIIVGFDQEYVRYLKPDCKNMLDYLATVIDICRFNSKNKDLLVKYIESGKCIPITNSMTCAVTDFNKEPLEIGFNHGVDTAQQFVKTYLE